MKIKFIELTEVNLASTFIWKVFSEFVAHEYPQEGIDTFKEFIQPEELQKMIENEKIFMLGCFYMEKLVGTVTIMDFCHVSLLFVDKEYQCRGIAKALFAKALELCIQKNPELCEMTVNSSTYAVPIYKRLGFHITGEPTKNNGIIFVPMKMNIIQNNFITLKK